MKHKKSHMRKRSRGFTLVDSMIGFLILAIGALAFCATVPVVSRSHHMADEQTKAVQIAQWQIEQVRQAGFLNLTFERLYPLGLVDDWDGDGPMTFTNAPVVHAGRFSPASQLRNGTGEMLIIDQSPDIREIRVTVKWTSPAGKSRSIELSTLVGKDS
jgi:type II secretory pathway pseudopilin PulG